MRWVRLIAQLRSARATFESQAEGKVVAMPKDVSAKIT
jgi:hypothetical protein